MKRAPRVAFSILASTTALALGASAQNIGSDPGAAPPAPGRASPPGGGTPAGGAAAPAQPAPAAPAQPRHTVTTTYRPIGVPQPGYDINPGLPSSSRPSTDTSKSGDSFDLVGPSGGNEVAR